MNYPPSARQYVVAPLIAAFGMSRLVREVRWLTPIVRLKREAVKEASPVAWSSSVLECHWQRRLASPRLESILETAARNAIGLESVPSLEQPPLQANSTRHS